MKKKQLVPRNKKIEINRETLRKLQPEEYAAVAGGSDCPTFTHLPHCPLCC